MLVKLTVWNQPAYSVYACYVAVEHIVTMVQNNAITLLHLTTGQHIEVRETPEEIIALMQQHNFGKEERHE